jgi:O-antigen ligase
LLKKKIFPLFIIGILVAYFLPRIAARFVDFFDTGNVSRLYLWLQSITLIQKSPICGYGPGDVPLYENIFNTIDMMTDPHNFILTIILHTGVIGFIIFLALMVVFIRRALMMYKKQKNPFFLVVLFAAVFHGSVEVTFLGYSYSFIFWYCMVMLLIQSEHAKRKHNGQLHDPTQQMVGIYS